MISIIALVFSIISLMFAILAFEHADDAENKALKAYWHVEERILEEEKKRKKDDTDA